MNKNMISKISAIVALLLLLVSPISFAIAGTPSISSDDQNLEPTDLAVVDITILPFEPKVGDTITVFVSLQNYGNQPVEAEFGDSVEMPNGGFGNAGCCIIIHPEKDPFTRSFSFVAYEPGTYVIKTEVQPTEVKDLDQSNNQLYMRFAINGNNDFALIDTPDLTNGDEDVPVINNDTPDLISPDTPDLTDGNEDNPDVPRIDNDTPDLTNGDDDTEVPRINNDTPDLSNDNGNDDPEDNGDGNDSTDEGNNGSGSSNNGDGPVEDPEVELEVEENTEEIVPEEGFLSRLLSELKSRLITPNGKFNILIPYALLVLLGSIVYIVFAVRYNIN